MHKRYALTILALIGLVASILACNAPPPQDLAPTETTGDPPTPPPQDTAPPPTETPPPPISTPTEHPPTETPTLTPTPTEQPAPTEAVSTGPLSFPAPAMLDSWQTLPDGKQEATIILHILGGAPPYTIYHDQTLVATTWETTPAIVFQAQGCSALVHAITVESADGQSVKHDYWIPVPWCSD